MTQELAVLPPIQPAELVRNVTDVAGLCKEVVVRTAKDIAGRKFVPVEGWMTIATAHGCIVTIISVEKIEGGVLAVAELRRAQDGFPMSRAEGFVGDDEETWHKRPEYARRAMAQTRAMSRVCRTAFAHVVVMMNAGLETTPMEEVPVGGFEDGGGKLTDEPVPPQYWATKKKSGEEAANEWLSRAFDGAKVGVRRTKDGWRVVVFGKTRESAGENEKETAPAAGKPAGNWGEVVCTYGKKNGPLRGKKLGDLNDDSLKYLAEIFLVEGKDVKQQDRKMVAALAIWQASTRKVAPTPNDGGLAEDQIQFNGKNHEELYKQLVWDEIKPSDFIDAMKSVKALPENAKDFRLMSEETATSLLADWDNAKEIVKKFLEGKASK